MTSVPFAYFGTPYVARDTLEKLLAAGYVPSVVITSPDSLRGRGLTLTPSETKVFAELHGIPVLSPVVLDDAAIQAIRAFGCAYAIAVAYGKIIPQTLIDTFPQGILNVHYSLLPKYRGASPVESALLSGDTQTGVTIQKMVFKLDAGDIISQEVVAIDPIATAIELKPLLIEKGSSLLIATLPAYLAGEIVPTPQEESNATRAPKIKKEEGLLSLGDNPLVSWNKYRAYKESPGTYFMASKGDVTIRVKIRTAVFSHDRFTIERIIPEGKTEQPFSYLETAGYSVL
jgi:methionyl-tRNA formyltransferase